MPSRYQIRPAKPSDLESPVAFTVQEGLETEGEQLGLVDSLLDFVASSARAAAALDLRLYVLRSNERATGAYRRCGFEPAPYTIMTRAF